MTWVPFVKPSEFGLKFPEDFTEVFRDEKAPRIFNSYRTQLDHTATEYWIRIKDQRVARRIYLFWRGPHVGHYFITYSSRRISISKHDMNVITEWASA